MASKRNKDPRTAGQKAADEEVLRLFEAGEILQVDPAVERAAIEALRLADRLDRESGRIGKPRRHGRAA